MNWQLALEKPLEEWETIILSENIWHEGKMFLNAMQGIYERMGRFNIDGWRLKTKTEV